MKTGESGDDNKTYLGNAVRRRRMAAAKIYIWIIYQAKIIQREQSENIQTSEIQFLQVKMELFQEVYKKRKKSKSKYQVCQNMPFLTFIFYCSWEGVQLFFSLFMCFSFSFLVVETYFTGKSLKPRKKNVIPIDCKCQNSSSFTKVICIVTRQQTPFSPYPLSSEPW